MRIKTRLLITFAISICLMTLLAFILVFYSFEIKKELEKEKNAHELVRQTTDLIMVGEEYIVYHYHRAFKQWNVRANSLKELLSKTEETETIKNMRINLNMLNESFLRLNKIYFKSGKISEKTGSEESVLLEGKLSGQLRILSHDMIAEALKLSEEITNRVNVIQKRSSAATLVFLISIIFLTTIAFYRTLKRITLPLTILVRDANIIRDGNLEHKITGVHDSPSAALKDEIGELSISFNDMTNSLLKSIANLELEVSERLKAEDELQKAHDALEWKVEERTAELQEELQVRKQAEKALKNNQYFLNNIIEQSPFATWISDKKGTIIKCNAALEKMLNITGEQLIGKYNVFEDEVAIEQGLIPKIRTVFEDGKTANFSVEWDANKLGYKDATKVHIEGTMFPIHDDKGNLTNVVDHWIDITERKQAELALNESNLLLSSVIESPDNIIIFALDRNYNYLAFNKAHVREMKRVYDADIEIGQHILTYIPREDDRLKADKSYKQVLQGKRFSKIEEYGQSNSRFWYELIFNPIHDTAHHVTGFTVFVTDITERKRIEADREQLRTAIEQVAETIIITDIEGDIQYANPAFEQITGYLREEVIGENPRFLKSGEHDEAFYHEMWQTITAGNTWRGRLINRKRDGTLYTEEASISPICDKAGKIVNFVGVKSDITDEIRIEENLRQAQKMESIGTLAGGIAHDFNNILFPIIGLSELLLEDFSSNSTQYEAVQEIFKAGMRARDLVKQILTFSRQTELRMIPIRVQQILKEVITLCRATIPSNIEINQDIQMDCGSVTADPTQIHQITMNLITNAYHAVENKNGKISVELKEKALGKNDLSDRILEPGRYAMLSVSDTGCGIDPAVLDKIFDPYFTTKEQGKGTGLGLSVLFGIVKKYHGDIKVDSQLGKGSTFTVYFPLMKKFVGTEPVMKVEKYPTGNERILLVDDEESILRMLSQALERLGYMITCHNSSNDALNRFKANPDDFDLVVTDMTMPNMTGYQLAKEVISIESSIPVIICTGFSEKVDQEKAKAVGIKGFLMKPVVKSEMAEMIRKVLDEAKDLD